MDEWHIKLERLFSSLGQDPIEDAPSIMDVTGTVIERKEWLVAISLGLSAAKNNSDLVINVINSSGYKISRPIEAVDYFIELRELYLKELDVL